MGVGGEEEGEWGWVGKKGMMGVGETKNVGGEGFGGSN